VNRVIFSVGNVGEHRLVGSLSPETFSVYPSIMCPGYWIMGNGISDFLAIKYATGDNRIRINLAGSAEVEKRRP
jgi:hypothetical protein